MAKYTHTYIQIRIYNTKTKCTRCLSFAEDLESMNMDSFKVFAQPQLASNHLVNCSQN